MAERLTCVWPAENGLQIGAGKKLVYQPAAALKCQTSNFFRYRLDELVNIENARCLLYAHRTIWPAVPAMACARSRRQKRIPSRPLVLDRKHPNQSASQSTHTANRMNGNRTTSNRMAHQSKISKTAATIKGEMRSDVLTLTFPCGICNAAASPHRRMPHTAEVCGLPPNRHCKIRIADSRTVQ